MADFKIRYSMTVTIEADTQEEAEEIFGDLELYSDELSDYEVEFLDIDTITEL